VSADPREGAPGAYVDAPDDGARTSRQWRRVAPRLAPPRRSLALARVALVAAACIALLIGVVVSRRGGEVATFEGTSIEGHGAGQTLRLPDGSAVVVSDATLLRVVRWSPMRVDLELERGEATLDVTHVEGRTWVVGAGRYDVRVVGTRFTVRRDADADRVSVDVERGRVEIVERDHGVARSLGAGESWQAAPAAAAPSSRASAAISASAAPTDPPSSAPSADPTGAPSEAPGARAASSPSWEELARARRFKEAYETIGASGFGSAVDAADAERLLRLAEVARASGHLRDAERAFDTLRRAHRSDPRAAMAAFELGRLRLDALGDPGGAAEALADAMALSPGAPFREDAEARRVQALEASGARGACEAARAAYLTRYPRGVHAAVVSARCPTK
jgi:transmembrane sensor